MARKGLKNRLLEKSVKRRTRFENLKFKVGSIASARILSKKTLLKRIIINRHFRV